MMGLKIPDCGVDGNPEGAIMLLEMNDAQTGKGNTVAFTNLLEEPEPHRD